MKQKEFFFGDSNNQRVHTPQIVLDFIAEVWPEGIALDPCGSPDGIVKADRIICPPEDGLSLEWPARTFINPPYRKLKPWLEKYLTCSEIFALVPVRTHRAWFRRALDTSRWYVWLDPLKFEGHANTYPQPLVLLYNGPQLLWGIDVEGLGELWVR